MSNIKVQISMSCRATFGGTFVMTREKYDELIARLDGARGFEEERVAEEVMEICNLSLRHADFDKYEVDDFSEVEP